MLLQTVCLPKRRLAGCTYSRDPVRYIYQPRAFSPVKASAVRRSPLQIDTTLLSFPVTPSFSAKPA